MQNNGSSETSGQTVIDAMVTNEARWGDGGRASVVSGSLLRGGLAEAFGREDAARWISKRRVAQPGERSRL